MPPRDTDNCQSRQQHFLSPDFVSPGRGARGGWRGATWYCRDDAVSTPTAPSDADERRSVTPDPVRLDNRQNATPDEIDGTFRALHVPVAPFKTLDAESQRLLRLWVNNVVMPIGWYDARIVTLERDRTQKNRAMKVVTWIGVACMALFYVGGLMYEPVRGLGLTAFQVSLLVTVALTAIEAATDASSLRQRYALFYKARADLRSLLYEFADRWGNTAEKPSDAPVTALPEDLRAAIETGLAKARDVLQHEQEQFFNTLRFPSDLTNLLFNQALPAVRARVGDNPLVGRATESLTVWRDAVSRERDARLALEAQQGVPDTTPVRLEELRAAYRAATAARERAERSVDPIAALGGR